MDLQQIYRTLDLEISLLSNSLKNEFFKTTEFTKEGNDFMASYQGKHLRSIMFFLAYHISKSNENTASYINSDIIKIATAIELIHTATLLHDDVVDDGKMRRWKASANVVYGNESAVLFGDFLFARAFSALSSIENGKFMQVLSKTSHEMCIGEINQTLNQCYPGCDTLTEDNYLKTIERKTAAFFSDSCKCGAIAGRSDYSTFNKLSDYGLNFGIAYQIIDDYVDLIGDEKTSEKTLRTDSLSGKFTLPIIYLLQEISACGKIENKKYPTLLDIWNENKKYQDVALRKTNSKIQFYIKEAKRSLINIPDSIYSEALSGLSEYFAGKMNFESHKGGEFK